MRWTRLISSHLNKVRLREILDGTMYFSEKCFNTFQNQKCQPKKYSFAIYFQFCRTTQQRSKLSSAWSKAHSTLASFYIFTISPPWVTLSLSPPPPHLDTYGNKKTNKQNRAKNNIWRQSTEHTVEDFSMTTRSVTVTSLPVKTPFPGP